VALRGDGDGDNGDGRELHEQRRAEDGKNRPRRSKRAPVVARGCDALTHD
jgi:hypothetical protein